MLTTLTNSLDCKTKRPGDRVFDFTTLEIDMSPQEVKQNYGATHFMPMLDGVTPQLFYKQKTSKRNDGTYHTGWCYLSFSGSWFGSFATAEELARLKEI